MLFDAGDYDDVLAEGRKVLAADPNTLVACRTVALALYASGDKTKYQEAADLLQRYVDLAPDTDPFKPSALDSLVFLKNVEGITPRKRR